MLRITTVNEEGQSVRLKVEGRIVGEWVNELDHACTVLLAQKKNIVLDFSDVRFIDRRGSEVLKKLRGERVNMIGASLLVQRLMEW
ncbi:MAG: STAS domain-containing protein [Nitrospirales bacterium]